MNILGVRHVLLLLPAPPSALAFAGQGLVAWSGIAYSVRPHALCVSVSCVCTRMHTNKGKHKARCLLATKARRRASKAPLKEMNTTFSGLERRSKGEEVDWRAETTARLQQ